MLILMQLTVIIASVLSSALCFQKAWSAESHDWFFLWNILAFILPMVMFALMGLGNGLMVPLLLLAHSYSEKLWERG